MAVLVVGLLVTNLRQHNPEAYERYGNPPAWFLMPWNIGAYWSFLFVILSGNYKGSAPNDLHSLFGMARLLFVIALIFGALLIALSASST